MGWIEVGGVRYYSLTQEIGGLMDMILEFFRNFAPGYYALFFMAFITALIIIAVYRAKRTLRGDTPS